jgi:hypothetical protein
MRLRSLATLLTLPAVAAAGMASPLPVHPEMTERLNESPMLRLQALSFFLVVLLGCTLVVWALWGALRRDFPALPRLSFGGACAGVLLCGLLFTIVLTMISGARELMTPGAWRKQGWTYKLASGPEAPDPDAERRAKLERLRTALWLFAATNNGRFPGSDETVIIAPDLWDVPDAPGLRYLYVPGLTATRAPAPLAYEPELDAAGRLVLLTNGEVRRMRSDDLLKLLKSGGRP